jgi:hypothetical protein
MCFKKKTLGFGDGTPIRSVGVRNCAWCGVDITPENDSGWEVFISPRETQPECKACHEAESMEKVVIHE